MGFDAPAMFPSNGVMTWRPLLSTGSLGMVPPLKRYYGTLRLPAAHLDPFEFFTSRYHRVARGLLPSVVGVPPGARELSVPVSPSGLTMETGREKGSSLNSASLTTKPLASSVYVHVPETPSPLKRS